MKRVFRGLIFAGMAGATLALGAPAAAQQQQEEVSPYVQQVAASLVAVTQQMGQNGYGNPELVAFNAINGGTSQAFSYATQDSGDIMIVGVCDNDCTDLDLRVRNAQGGVVGEDVLTDAIPVVPAPAGGRPLNIDVIMAACSQDPCVFGVAVYRRQ